VLDGLLFILKIYRERSAGFYLTEKLLAEVLRVAAFHKKRPRRFDGRRFFM
jgi:hypothetical protein